MRPIKMVFISTNVLTRGGVAQIVAHANPPIEIVGAFADFQAVYRYASQNIVDVVLIDEALPLHTNLLHEVKILYRECVGVTIIVILQRPIASLVQRLLEHGVRGILHKNDNLEHYLMQAIIWGKQRGIHLSPGVSHFVDTQRNLPVALNQRDLDVLKLLAEGLAPKEIAVALGIGGNTVYRILRRLRDTLNAQNNAHLVTITYETKLIHSQ